MTEVEVVVDLVEQAEGVAVLQEEVVVLLEVAVVVERKVAQRPSS